MEFKTLEQKFLADYAMLEQENDLLKQENERLRRRVVELKAKVEALDIDITEISEAEDRLMVERDHHADCVKDMLAMAKWYGFDQPQQVEYNPETGGVKAVERE